MAQPLEIAAEHKNTTSESPEASHELPGVNSWDPQAQMAANFRDIVATTGDAVLSIKWLYNNAFKNLQLNPGSELEAREKLLALQFPPIITQSQEVARNMAAAAKEYVDTWASLKQGGDTKAEEFKSLCEVYDKKFTDLHDPARELYKRLDDLRVHTLYFWMSDMEYDLPNFVSGDQLLQTRTFVKSIREQYLEPVQAKFRALEKLWIDFSYVANQVASDIEQLGKAVARASPKSAQRETAVLKLLGNLEGWATKYADEARVVYQS